MYFKLAASLSAGVSSQSCRARVVLTREQMRLARRTGSTLEVWARVMVKDLQFSGKPIRRSHSSSVLSCIAQNCGALFLLVQGRYAYHFASESTSGLSLSDSASAAFPPPRSPLSANAAASPYEKYQSRGFAVRPSMKIYRLVQMARHQLGPTQ